MRYSKLFGKTLRQAPAEAESVSHQLLLRSGMIAEIWRLWQKLGMN